MIVKFTKILPLQQISAKEITSVAIVEGNQRMSLHRWHIYAVPATINGYDYNATARLSKKKGPISETKATVTIAKYAIKR